MHPDTAPSEEPAQAPRSTKARPRSFRSATVTDLEAWRKRARGCSERQFARKREIARSTLRNWRRRAVQHPGMDETQRRFLESPSGLALLHRILLAALVVMVLMGGLGVAQVRLFLRLCGLHTVIACSATHLRMRMRGVLREVVEWGRAQERTLASQMAPREITVAVDETFHGGMLLVALEMVSGYLLLEAKSQLRDGATWSAALKARLAEAPVKVVQVVADEARGLWALARQWLGAEKVADLFHGQYELGRGVLSGTRAKVHAAQSRAEEARGEVTKVLQARADYEAASHGPGRPPDWQGRLDRACDAAGVEEQALHLAEEQHAGLRRCVRDLGETVHAVDPVTGQIQSPAEMAEKLSGIFDEIWQRAVECNLGGRASEAIAKVKRLVPTWIAALTWWHRMLDTRLGAAGLDAGQTRLVREVLLPIRYLQRELGRASTRPQCVALRARIEALTTMLHAPGCVWPTLSAGSRQFLVHLAQDCVDLYQRASSCVEGRNGYLALRHHQMHALPDPTLQALTVVHNYVLTRADGTTSAERLFGQRHEVLFSHLCAVMPLPARPRRRACKAVEDPLALVA